MLLVYFRINAVKIKHQREYKFMTTNCMVSLKTDATGLNLEPVFRVVNQGIKWGVKSTEYLADKTSIFK